MAHNKKQLHTMAKVYLAGIRYLLATSLVLVSIHTNSIYAAEVSLQFEDITGKWTLGWPVSTGLLPHKRNTVYLNTDDGHVFFYNLDTRKLSEAMEFTKLDQKISMLAWSPDGRNAAFTSEKEIVLFNYYSGKSETIVKANDLFGPALIWMNDHELLFTAKGGILIVDTKTRNMVRLVSAESGQPFAHAYIPSRKKLIYGINVIRNNGDFTTLIKEAELTNRKLVNPRTIMNVILGGEINPTSTSDGRYLAFVAGPWGEKKIYIADSTSGQYVSVAGDEDWSERYCIILPDGSGLIAMSVRDEPESGEVSGKRKAFYHLRYAKLGTAILELNKLKGSPINQPPASAGQ